MKMKKMGGFGRKIEFENVGNNVPEPIYTSSSFPHPRVKLLVD
jgi:hypothetical protein